MTTTDFTIINPDQIHGKSLDEMCAEVLEHHRDLIGLCLNRLAVLAALKGRDEQQRQDALWKIRGAAKAQARTRRLTGEQQRPAKQPVRSNPRHAAARARRKNSGPIGRETPAKAARSRSKKPPKAGAKR